MYALHISVVQSVNYGSQMFTCARCVFFVLLMQNTTQLFFSNLINFICIKLQWKLHRWVSCRVFADWIFYHVVCQFGHVLLMIFLANVNSSSGSLYVVVRPSVVCLSSVVCNVRAPYSGDWNFRKCFYAIWYLGHQWPLCKNFTEIVPGEPLWRMVKPKRGSKI